MCEQAALTGLDGTGDSCCTQLCDVNDADFTCSSPQQECLPLFDTMDPIYGHVGQCRLP